MPAENTKFIPVGVSTDNECCICCDSCWAGAPGGDVIPAPCDPETDPGCDAGPCPRSCCPCPPLGSLCMTLDTDGVCPHVDGMEITLTTGVGVAICSGDNPLSRDGMVMCYPPGAGYDGATLQTGIQQQNNNYEKWGFQGLICNGKIYGDCHTYPYSSPTVGEYVNISLCCCDVVDEWIVVTENNKADCHTCSYRLTFEWQKRAGKDGASDLCTCPMDVDQHVVPACSEGTDPVDCTEMNWDLTFGTGVCPSSTVNPTPKEFLLVYELAHRNGEGGWWNCDCCRNGNGVGDNNVRITATIVAEEC